MKILVIGDIIIDIYYYCRTNRNAPEANIPIYNVEDKVYILGGAANVATNFKNLNCNIELVSVMGNDDMCNKCKELLDIKKKKYNLFTDETRKSTQKNRTICDKKIVNRFDIENTHNISKIHENNIFEYIKTCENLNAIVLSDYAKGVLTENLCNIIINYCNENNILSFVDPKINDYIKYKNCFCFKPNFFEATNISKMQDIIQSYNYIKNSLKSEYIIITNGEDGLYINDEHIKINNNVNNVIDVTGAGDIALTILTYIYIKYEDMILAGKISNYICGKSIQYIGNYNISLKDIDEYYKTILFASDLKNKIIYNNEYDKLQFFEKIKEEKKIVFTNGCFDIIHSAHIKLLQYAKKQGDILIVGINSDESIKKIKGDKRPINTISERVELLKCFDFIDFIVVFNEDTPFNILSMLKPNIIVKGGDYRIENIIGSQFADKILIFNLIENKSTSLVIKNIIEKF
jgi:D-beta-D-heptose 7-phosphate kinase/D-beta-D-heptose 1-phosphate adenosyltransferase